MGDIRKGTLQLMWGGVWVPVGEAEFIATDDGRIEKVVSFTPKAFKETGEGETASDPNPR